MDVRRLLDEGDRNLAEVLRLIASTAPEGEHSEVGGVLLTSASRTWPGPYHNAAMRLDHAVPAADVLGLAQEFYSARCPGYCLWISAHADADLEECAIDLGLVRLSERGTPRMATEKLPAMPDLPPGITLDEVADEQGRLDYLSVTVDAYSESPLPREAAEAQMSSVDALAGPSVRAVIARDGGQPVSAAMVVVTGEVGGIQLVGTVHSSRGRHLAEICTAWVSRAAFDLGATAIVLEASEQGEPLYRRMGFTEISRYRLCFGPPPSRGLKV